jgi:hypothetical protein
LTSATPPERNPPLDRSSITLIAVRSRMDNTPPPPNDPGSPILPN